MFKKQNGNFTKVRSPLYFNNNGYIHICNTCLIELYDHYVEALNSEDAAIRRMCMKFDIYFNPDIIQMTRNGSTTNSRIKAYISKTNLAQIKGSTYDDTLDEESGEIIESIEDVKEKKNVKVSQKTVKFWGTGFTEADYVFLNDKYEEWTTRHECQTKAQESLFQKIALLELKIMRATQNGEKLEPLINAYNALLGSANVKPVQNNDNTLADQNTFGTLIQKWENEKPIPESDPVLQDVDGIRRYISIWFLGHLCKMMGIHNSYGNMYEEEIARLSVEQPNYVEDDVASEYDMLFNGDGDSSA